MYSASARTRIDLPQSDSCVAVTASGQTELRYTSDVATRPVLRIFISSTAVDLRDYRHKVRDAVLGLKNLPIQMETFSAQSRQPASEVMQMAAEADAVICIVAHRYGYVPPKELGGDGERSITWLEVDAAKHAGKPVFAFLIDPKAPWTQAKEQDRLVTEPEKAAEIFKAVQRLQEFKAYLESEFTRKTFANGDELTGQVAITLANFAPQPGSASVSTARVWKPLYCYALQPAQHFRGRAGSLQELKDWLQASVTPDRVVSVVAAGGTGKTALVDKALHDATLSDRAGLFVWSFYEDPHTDAFLRAAFLYFTGEKGTPTGGLLERLQLALSGDLPHLLVLDGLERVQSEGDRRRRGELDDLQLKRLLRGLAGSGNSRALVTSRFPLIDLAAWTGAGHHAIALDDLELAVAIEVLRDWKVNGNDAVLTHVLEPYNTGGFYHALSVAVLGSFIGNFAGGEPSKAPKFSLTEAEESDSKAEKLRRILEQYAEALIPVERDLLARLSLFPRGAKVEILSWIVQSGGEVAGALTGLANHELMKHLERLKALGLVFRYQTDGQIAYSAHPFLRQFFRSLLTAKPESVHESVRAGLAPSLDAQPDAKPSDPALLDQYELLIEQTLLAGHVKEAFDLYRNGLGTSKNLAWVLGENIRGLRTLERFVPEDDFSHIETLLSPHERSMLVDELGLFAYVLGDLARARGALAYCQRLDSSASDKAHLSSDAQNLGGIELSAGHFQQALSYCDDAVKLSEETTDKGDIKNALAVRAMSHFAVGGITAASADFMSATKLEGKPLLSIRGAFEAECRFLQGDGIGACSLTRANREFAVRYRYNDDLCRCNILLAQLLLKDDCAQADQHLREARVFAHHSGFVELQLRCFQAACDLHRYLRDYLQALAEAEGGILLADTCGFGKYSIDLRLALAETLLAAGDSRKALQSARDALDRSEHSDCQYAWGQADGLHFCGLAHLRLGERELARQRLTAALELRERLGHGRIEETRRALELANRNQ
jgi:tetratricopeptide (TPR) repeat protein